MATEIVINGQTYAIEQGHGGYTYYRVTTTNRFGKKVKAKDGYIAVWNSTTGTPNPDIGLDVLDWGVGSVLPPGVTAGQYALVSNTLSYPYIDLGFKATTDHDVECRFKIDDFDGNQEAIPFGSRNENLSKYFTCLIGNFYVTRRKFYAYNCGSFAEAGATGLSTQGYALNDWQIGDKTGTTQGTTFDGRTRISGNITNDEDQNFNSLLFGYNYNNDPLDLTPIVSAKRFMRIEYYKHWTDATRTVYLRNMWAVPAGMSASGTSSSTTSDIGTTVINGIAPSNCMYCSETDMYYENRGTGSFGIETL